jgi:hypothetical protein
MADSIDHLRTELKMLGNQHKRWKEKEPILHDLIRRAHDAGMKQAEIVELAGYKRDNIRLLCMDPAQREELRARRRRRGVDQLALEANPQLVERMEATAADPSSRVRRGRPKRKES